MAWHVGACAPHAPVGGGGGVSNVTAFPGTEHEQEALTLDLTDIPPIMTSQELAEVLRVSMRTVERMRADGDGPAAKKLPGSSMFRYSRESVQRWWVGLTDAFEVDAS